LNPIKILAKQTVVYGLSSILPKFLNYFLVPLYTYYFKPAEYGIIGDLYSLTVILNIILTYGMETAFFWFSKNDVSRNVLFSTSFISILTSTFIFFGLIFLFSERIAISLDYPSKKEYIIWLSLIISLDTISAIPFVKLRQENKAIKFSLIKIISVFINVLLNIIYLIVFPYLALKGIISSHGIVYDKSIGVGYVLIANIISSGATLIFLFSDLRIKISFDFLLWKKMLKYSLPLLVAGLAGGINDAIDRQFIKYMSPDGVDPMSELGIYFANIKIAVILTVFIQTFRFAAEPFFFNYEKEIDSREVFAKIMKYFVFISLLVYLFTFGNLPVLKYFINYHYWSGLKIIPIVLAANVLVGVYINLSIWYKLSNKNLFGVLIILFGAFLTIILNYFLVPIFGYVASAYTRLLCYFVMVILCYFFGNIYYRIPYNLVDIGFYFLLAIVGYIIINIVSFYNIYFQLVVNNLMVIFFVFIFLWKENFYRLFNTIKK
jgi:O-antigen/teichoic acid export membrane protein